jgi:uncharacterized protein YdeI (YjbR/CyaY-like superfamily)
MDIIYFTTIEELRAWLEANHASAKAIQLGLKKKGADWQGITYEEALLEALCFGWIDGVTHSIDAERWTVRFTPRSPKSKWSTANIRRVEGLIAQGRMTPTGMAAFADHKERTNELYDSVRDLDEAAQARFAAADPAGWEFFQAQPPSYRRIASRWLMDARREETRLKRLDELIALSGQGERKQFM